MEKTIFEVVVYKTKARKTICETRGFATLLDAENYVQEIKKPSNIKQLYIKTLNGREFVIFNAEKSFFGSYN